MKERLKLFGWIGLYWIVFFVFSRSIFLFYHFNQTSSLKLIDILTLNFLGLRMDLAMAGYWLILTGLLLTVSVFTLGKALYYINNTIITILLLISAAIVVADLELYKQWGFRMDTTPLMYARGEGIASANPYILLLLIFIFSVLFCLFIWFYYARIAKLFLHLPRASHFWAIILFLITASLFVPIRSSFTVAPLNTGVVYFHKTKVFPNHAGINVVWNFFLSVVSTKTHKYAKDFYSPIEAETLLSEMTKSEPDSNSFLSTPKPNIILIVLESFTSKIIKPLGGLDNITPNFNKLTHEGVLFDNFYASGDRTDKGIVSILSGYPAQPLTSIIKFPNKTESLPFLPRVANSLGYSTSFIYGGDISFANMESYIISAGFSHITEDDDFDDSINTSKWGVHDQFVFDRLLAECDTASNPFFKVMLSLSSHEPFDVPMKPIITGNDDSSLFLNSCIYTDICLGNFISQAKQQSWWENTWIIITADHGHRHPNQEEIKEKERFKIPMLWLGGAITKRDTVIRTFAGQTDIANTVLAQLKNPVDKFKFSKNILSKEVRPFATYIFHNGYGYIDPNTENIYDFDFKKYIKQEGKDDDLKWGKAYMQVLFTDYNKR
ncbi:MAG: sulfatase-like hydrolase/transferase [Bacteroidia bacterium]|nr:sulfatase-like hydrolase/transferase [Bacteroidia bacterium]